ncbi:BrnT family toxin [Myxosarcina sp. GI1]|uniref:BrnT family toxin n=1 Tax=Myxosarcina sp. GI1 TaxID=1541065 RepID=UPI00209CC663
MAFEKASEVFFAPFYQTGDASFNKEKREFIIRYSSYYRLLLVVFVERDRRNRIISDRPATRAERKLYENA